MQKAGSIFLSGLLFGFVLVAGVALVSAEPAHASPSLADQIICLEFDINNHVIGGIVTLSDSDFCPPETSTTTAALTVIKHVDNSAGGTASASDFTMQVAGQSPSLTSFPGSESGTIVSLDAGSYSVSESGGPANYNESQSADCSGSVAAGDTKTCTVTNTYVPPVTPTTGVLEVTKVIVGGTDPNPQDFSFIVTSSDGPGSAIAFDPSGITDMNVAPGTFSVAEVASSTYVTTYANSQNENTDCSELTVSAGATTTCTITNTAQSEGGGGGGGPTTSDLSVTKSVDNPTPDTGDTVTYTLTVSDTGADATGVVINDSLPSGVTFVATSSSDTVGVYDSGSGTWTIGDLSSTSPATLHITVMVNGGLDDGTVVTNTASVSAGDTSGDSENNSGSASFIVTTPGSNTTPSGGGGGGGGGGVIGGPLSVGYGGGGGGIVLGTSTEAAPTTCGPLLISFLRIGRNNNADQVKKLQTFLNTTVNAKLPVTGFFGTLTDKAVRAFQLQYNSTVLAPWVPYGLPNAQTPTGYVYKTTRRMINNLYCASLNLPLPALP